MLLICNDFFVWNQYRRIKVYTVFFRAGETVSEPERVVFGSLEQEPLEKKSGAGARAAKILDGSSALLEDAYGNCTFVNLQIVSFYG